MLFCAADGLHDPCLFGAEEGGRRLLTQDGGWYGLRLLLRDEYLLLLPIGPGHQLLNEGSPCGVGVELCQLLRLSVLRQRRLEVSPHLVAQPAVGAAQETVSPPAHPLLLMVLQRFWV
jgi:hypothetical protein